MRLFSQMLPLPACARVDDSSCETMPISAMCVTVKKLLLHKGESEYLVSSGEVSISLCATVLPSWGQSSLEMIAMHAAMVEL